MRHTSSAVARVRSGDALARPRIRNGGQIRLLRPSGQSGQAATAAGLAGCCSGKRHLVVKWEVKRPHLDVVKIPTVCVGRTHVVMRHYTTPECLATCSTKALTSNRYAADVARCAPIIADKPYLYRCAHFPSLQHRHLTPIADRPWRRFNAGDFIGRVQWFLFHGPTPGRRSGLLNRRRDERKLCLRDKGSEPLFHPVNALGGLLLTIWDGRRSMDPSLCE